MEECEEIRHTLGMSDLYKKRKETIERLFGTAKESHGFRYTQMYGKARMELKVGLTFACKFGWLDRCFCRLIAFIHQSSWKYREKWC